jgi:nucleotide-binding universal stress UspA family protein
MPNPAPKAGHRAFVETPNDLLSPSRRQSVDAPRQSPPREKAIRKILVATDFSPSSAEAVREAVTIANERDAELTILHVIDINAQAGPAQTGPAQALMEELWKEGSARMGQLACSFRGSVDAQTVVREGLPWEEIVEKSREFELLVLGESAPKRSWRFFAPHTGKRVAENAACPVMIVRQ